jgi:putative SOS response-associated peptidase YedK
MCASYEARFNVTQLVEWFARAEAPLDQSYLPNLPEVDELKPTDPAVAVLATGGQARLATMRFGFPPPQPKARPVVNLRSEGRRFENRDWTGRCLVPVSGFYEFTGDKYPKTRWIFRDTERPFVALAAIWRAGEGDAPGAFSLLTTTPGPDVAPYHDRGVIPVPPDRWAQWLKAERFPDDLAVAPPAGTLIVSAAPRQPKT